MGQCIDSVIGALDELIVVYNDCTDNTEDVLIEKQRQYPDKLKLFPYNHKVLSFDLSREEFEYAKTLPDDSPRLYCNQCNYGLAQMTCKYAVKIDADQIYFEDEIKKWRDVCNGETNVGWRFSFVGGWFFMMYFTLYRRLSSRMGRPLVEMLPTWLVRMLSASYITYAKWRLARGRACIALSGVNLFKDDDGWYVPFDRYNIHPPYNGSGDTVIFKLTDETYFSRRYSDVISYSVTELFHCPYKMMFAGPVWFHLHANRAYCFDKVRKVKEQHPELFVRPADFVRMTYGNVLRKMDPKVNALFQRILFALVHKMGIDVVKRHLRLLERITV